MGWEDMPDSLINALRELDSVGSLSTEEQMARTQEFHRLITDAGFLKSGYKVRPLTGADIDRAAETVLTIGAIPTLKRGVVTFEDGLEGGRWYDDHDSAYYSDQYLVVEIPEQLDLESARAAVLAGLEDARDMIKKHDEDDSRGSELLALEIEAVA